MSADPRPGHRERKKRETRQAIGLAALRLAVEQGLAAVRVEAIAEAAGVSTRTFNNYFASKYEAICALAVDRAAVIGDALRDRPPAEPFWTAVGAAVLYQYGATESPSASWLAGLRLVVSEPALIGEYLKAQATMQDHLAAAIAARLGTRPDDLLPHVVAAAVGVTLGSAQGRWLRADPPVPLEPIVRDALRELAGYLALPDTLLQEGRPW